VAKGDEVERKGKNERQEKGEGRRKEREGIKHLHPQNKFLVTAL